MATCSTCTWENPAAAANCAACGASLSPACRRCGTANGPESNFCNHCGLSLRPWAVAPGGYTPRHLAEKILTSRTALEGERKQVTVLFCDVKGSMDLARQVGAEEWHRILDRFFAVLAGGVHRFEGTVNQYTGDGVMALFGAPLAHEDHGQRACHAALFLRRRLSDLARELRASHDIRFAVRMGLNSGEVIVGRIGDDLRMDYTAQGHTVGLAARMEQMAGADKIFLTGQTAALVDGYFALGAIGRRRVKGVGAPVQVFALTGPGKLRTRLDVSRARGLQTFVGRADEIAQLRAALDRALSGYGQVVGIVGEAGLGKSRLCQEFVDLCRAEGIAVAATHGSTHGRTLPSFTIVELLRDWLGGAVDIDARGARQRVTRTLRRFGGSLASEVPFALDLLGLPQRPPPPAIKPDERRERLATLMQRLVQTQSAAAPLVLLVDDAHWLDSESNAVLEHLVGAAGWTRTLLLLNFRPEYRPPWANGSVSYYTRVELQPLPPTACEGMLADLLGRDAETAGLRALIRERAEGNPFFLEEIVQSLAQQGLLQASRVGEGGPRWRPSAELSEVSVARVLPATIQALVAARIDRLGEAEKLVLQTAAVIGKSASPALLEQTLVHLAEGCAAAGVRTPPRVDVRAALDLLADADFVRRDDGGSDEFVFRHPLTQEVAYHSQLAEARRRGHEAVARALEAVHSGRLGQQAALIAHHWDAAERRGAAGAWRQRAALNVTNIQVGRTRRPTR